MSNGLHEGVYQLLFFFVPNAFDGKPGSVLVPAAAKSFGYTRNINIAL
jgi:hypothetical protein